MSKNTNIINKTTDSITNLTQQAGMMLMGAAALAGMLELPNHENKAVVLPSKPVFAFAEDTLLGAENNPIRREKDSEETGPHFISYSVTQRTPARAGKQ